MRDRTKAALKCKQEIHKEKRKLEEVIDDPVAMALIKINQENLDKELQQVPHRIVAGECLPAVSETNDMDVWSPTSTLLHPNSISQTASLDRMALAEATGHQDLAIDAAETIGAANSLEKMLAHQMAVCHAESMKLVAIAGNVQDNMVALKMLNAATRFMDIFQKGFEVIHKVKRGNRQTIIIKHQQVNVGNGGQAVIADNARGVMGSGDV